MPRKAATVVSSPVNSFESTTSASMKSEKSTLSVHDTDYHQSLRYHNIFIERETTPPELVRRANRIISRPRASPGIDDTTIQKLKDKVRRLRDEGEDVIIKQLGPHIIPEMSELPDQRLEMNADQLWYNAIPVQLDASVLTNPLPLPKPKPDIAFGYSEVAFTRSQLSTIDLLVDDQFGRSFAPPDQKIRFPFLHIEFKSQAKSGTHYIATNQAAIAGAIALNGTIDLIQCTFGMEKFDYDEPQYFFVTMDHEFARITVHWLRAPAQEGQHGFHVEGLSKHLLDDPNGIRALSRAIKNILDNGADAQLRTLCKALDAYRDTVIRNRATANAQARQGYNNILATPQITRQTRGIERQPQNREQTNIPTTASPEISQQSAIAPTPAGASLTHSLEDNVITCHPETRQTRRHIRPTQKVLENANARRGRDRKIQYVGQFTTGPCRPCLHIPSSPLKWRIIASVEAL